jgi:CheY-like chemotaxis protein
VDSKTQELFSTSLLLQRFEYKVWSANTAGQALEMVSVAIPALVIADLVLPGMSGMDLFHLFRQDPRTVSLPVVFLIPAGDRIAETVPRSGSSRLIRGRSRPRISTGCPDGYRAQSAQEHPNQTRMAVSVNNEPRCIEASASILSEHGMYRRSPAYPRTNIVRADQIKNRTVSAEATVLYRHAYGEGPLKSPAWAQVHQHRAQRPGFYTTVHQEEVTRGVK